MEAMHGERLNEKDSRSISIWLSVTIICSMRGIPFSLQVVTQLLWSTRISSSPLVLKQTVWANLEVLSIAPADVQFPPYW